VVDQPPGGTAPVCWGRLRDSQPVEISY